MKKARHFVGRRLRQQQWKGTGASRSYAKDPDLSLKAARRFGIKFEGTLRSAALVKGKHVDFAWHCSPPVKTGPWEIRPGRRPGRTSSQPRTATCAASAGR